MVAVVASGVGVAVTVDQLTLRSRLRRTAELADALGKLEDNDNRKTVLRSVHNVAVARLTAGWLVPWWRFAEFVGWFTIGPVALSLSAARFGWTDIVQTTAISVTVLGTIMFRRGIRIFSERQRIACEYLSGAVVAPPCVGMLQQMEGGVRAEFVMGALVSVGVNLTGLGVGLLVFDSNGLVGFICLLLGLFTAVAPMERLGRHAVRPLEMKLVTPKTDTSGC